MKICVSKIQNSIKKYITQKEKNIQLFILFILLFLFLYIILYNVHEGFSMGSITGGGNSSSQYNYLSPPDPSNISTNVSSLTVDEANAFIDKYNSVNDLSGNEGMNQAQLNSYSQFLTADEVRYYTQNGSYPYCDYVTNTFIPNIQKRFPNRYAYMIMSMWSKSEAKLNTNAYQVYTGKLSISDASK